MSETASHTTRDPRAEHPCPACGEPRSVLARRHKVLGAWVPEWQVQPCRNPRCERYEPEPPGADHETADGAAAGNVAEAASTYVTGKNGETGRSPAPG